MSRIKLLLDLIEDVRAVADDLQTIADAMASDEPAAEPTETPVQEVPAAKDAGYTDIFRKDLITLSEMEKLMGKKKFNDILGGLVFKPQGKPTLVPDTDKRPAITGNDAKSDFKKITEVM